MNNLGGIIYVPSSSLGSHPKAYNVFMDIFSFASIPYNAESFTKIMNFTVDMSLLYGTEKDGNTTGHTVREALMYLAGRAGGCVIINRYDEMQFVEYSFANIYETVDEFSIETEYLITDNDVADFEVMGDGVHGMKYIECAYSQDVVRYEDSTTKYKNGFVLDSPLNTTVYDAKSILDHINNIYRHHGGIFYMTPCYFKLMNGDVSIELGDIISYAKNKNFAANTQSYIPIMHIKIKYTGKPDIEIESYSKTDAEHLNRVGPIYRSFTAFKRVSDNNYKYLDEAFKTVSNQIMGADGGYIVVDKNEDGTWCQMRVLDNVDKPNSMIVLNKNGIGFSNDGSGNITSAAITIDGKIVANSMTGGVLQAAQGEIGGWNVEEKALYSDFDYPIDSDGYNCYRVYLQNASATVNSKDAWAISVQQGTKDADGAFNGIGKFVVQYDGSCFCDNGLSVLGDLKMDSYLYDRRGYQVIGENNNMVFGYGAYAQSQNAYYEGGIVHLRYKSGNKAVIEEGGSEVFSFDKTGWKFSAFDTDFVKRNTMNSSSNFVISANGGDNILFLTGSIIRLMNATTVYGMLTAISSIKAQGGITVDGSNYLNLYKSGNEVWIDGQNNNLILDGSSYIECNSPFRLNFYATSGTVPLVVNTNGQITTATSSKRYKENITDELEDWLNPEKLYDLPVVQYNYKDDFKDIELVAGTQIGITAEDVDKHYPNACIYNKDGQPESWQDRIMIPAMLKLIQEQKSEIDSLKEEITQLKTIVEKLRK